MQIGDEDNGGHRPAVIRSEVPCFE
jgi:hypothetical protein